MEKTDKTILGDKPRVMRQALHDVLRPLREYEGSPAAAKQLGRLLGEAVKRDVMALGLNAHTCKNRFTMMRKVAEEALDLRDEPSPRATRVFTLKAGFLSECLMPVAVLEEVHGRALERREERGHGMASMPLADAYRLAARLWYMAESNDACERFVGLVGVSGRRPVEVRRGNFGPDGEGNGCGYRLWFTGQAKTRSTGESGYSIPLIPWNVETGSNYSGSEAETFANAVDGVIAGVSATDCRPALMTLLEHGWPEAADAPTLRGLRGFYACFTHEEIAGEARQRWHWINEVLGHTPDDMETCQTYDRFRFTSA